MFAVKLWQGMVKIQNSLGVDIPDQVIHSSVKINEVWEAPPGFAVYSDEYFSEAQSESDAAFLLWSEQASNESLKIIDLVDPKFKFLHPSKIDFRRHLNPNIYLQKNVVMLPNGRPQKSLYYHNSDLIAEIEFTFEVNAFNFMTRRTEKLAYYKKSGERAEQFVIADDLYDQANPYHLREMMKERSESRALIIEEVKAFLNGVLAQYYLPQGKTYAEILGIGGQFWDKYSTPIDSWINVGAPQFKDMLTADTEFAFLDVTVAPSVTVRGYILNKTSY